MKREENWLQNYKLLRAYVRRYGHYPKRDTQLYNWCRYNTKLKNKGMLDEKKTQLLDIVADMRQPR